MSTGTLGVIGVGNMGAAIVRGLIAADMYSPRDITVFDPDLRREEEFRSEGVNLARSIPEAGESAATVLIAVKPGTVAEVLRELRGTPAGTLILSVAAGITTRAIEEVLPNHPVVRIMPNTPCMVGAAASAVARGRNASGEHIRRALEIMGALGYAVEVPESLMDAVTGLSGSGPAYVAVMIDALASGGVRMGLPYPTALRLAAQTVLGTAKMLLERDIRPGELRDMVTSPGGTTAEGLMALERGAFRASVMEAVEASTLKSKKLGE